MTSSKMTKNSIKGDDAMNKTIHGIVHGKTIELDEELSAGSLGDTAL